MRELLSRLGIDINSAENGVFLPNKPGSTAPGAYHPSLHGDEYYDAVETALSEAESREEAISISNRIRRELTQRINHVHSGVYIWKLCIIFV